MHTVLTDLCNSAFCHILTAHAEAGVLQRHIKEVCGLVIAHPRPENVYHKRYLFKRIRVGMDTVVGKDTNALVIATSGCRQNTKFPPELIIPRR